jgi:hypothetical protein
MGAWGTALYSDDLAADLKSDFRDLIGDGLSGEQALARLLSEYATSVGDQDEAPVFWLAIADTAWRLGRPLQRASSEALRIIENGADLRRWDDGQDRRKREAMLQGLAARLRSESPPPRRVPKPFVAHNAWEVSEVVAYRLASGSWTLFRVIGHHQDKGGRSAVCEPLDWIGPSPPAEISSSVGVRRPEQSHAWPQFLLGEPRRKSEAERLLRTGIRSTPAQKPSGYGVLVFPFVDQLLREIYGLE